MLQSDTIIFVQHDGGGIYASNGVNPPLDNLHNLDQLDDVYRELTISSCTFTHNRILGQSKYNDVSHSSFALGAFEPIPG